MEESTSNKASLDRHAALCMPIVFGWGCGQAGPEPGSDGTPRLHMHCPQALPLKAETVGLQRQTALATIAPHPGSQEVPGHLADMVSHHAYSLLTVSQLVASQGSGSQSASDPKTSTSKSFTLDLTR